MRSWEILERWQDLPDPRSSAGETIEIVFNVAAWNHCQKHLTNKQEPWEEELGKELVQTLRKGVELDSQEGRVVAIQILRILRNLTEESLRWGVVLTLLVKCARSMEALSRAPWHYRWLLVLPSGAIAVEHQCSQKKLCWVTCYYPRAAAVVRNRRQRWTAAVRTVVRRYVPLDGNKPQVRLPEFERIVIRNRVARERDNPTPVVEARRNIRFLNPQRWGFCPDLDGCPWRGRPDAWPAAEKTPEEKPRKRRPLKSRFNLSWNHELDEERV